MTPSLDDVIGPQLGWEEDHCPARGPMLTHYVTRKPVGTCLHCGKEVVLKIDLDEVEAREIRGADQAETYRKLARLHGAATIFSAQRHRPLQSAAHQSAQKMLSMSSVSEEINREPADD